MDQLNNSVIRGAATGGDVNMRAGRSAGRGAQGGGVQGGGEGGGAGGGGGGAEGVAARGTRRRQSVSSRRSVRSCRVFTRTYEKNGKIFDRQYHSPSKVLKLEDDPWGSCAMYSPDKMKSGGGLMAPPGCFPGRYSPPPTYRGADPRRCVPNPSSRILEDASLMCNSWSPRHNGDLFGGLNDGLLSRAEALAVDIGKHQAPQPGPPLPQLKHDMVYHHGAPPPPHNAHARPHQMGHHGMEPLDMLDPLSSSSMTTLAPMGEGAAPHQLHPYGMNHVMNHHHALAGHGAPAHAHLAHHAHAHPTALHPDADTDPRELEAFAERFKQRRIKLGVTQADVGKALANLKLPGVGALSQSTICRFESLTLSHNNMIALKPILQAWLEEAEAQAKNKRRDPDAPSVLPAGEKKRKRTSIAAPEKRSLEAYFAVQPRPSGEKIAAIAEKLDLKKNVVRVWFCNQRQKQKRMKFAAQH